MRRRYSKQHGRNKRQYHQKRYGESLERLEEEMFEPSVLAGIAGNYQWGLDAGDHQGSWNPYGGTEHLYLDDRESSEDEHEVSSYIPLDRIY
jgi:hypothetical protein